MTFQLSPGVVVTEIDLTTVVPSVSSTTGAFAGEFQWGPVNQLKLVTFESELVQSYGKPNDTTATSFFSAANFLAYGNTLLVSRAANTGTTNAGSGANTRIQIANEDVYEIQFLAQNNNNLVGPFVARHPGVLGNTLTVSVCSGNTGGQFSSWAYKNTFQGAPNTSTYVSNAGGAYDQMHIAVIDSGGLVSGTKGTVLETFSYVSKASDARTDDGSPNYYKQVILNSSRYIFATDPVDYANTSATWGSTAADTVFAVAPNQTISLDGAVYVEPSDADIIRAWDLFRNPDEVDISLVISGEADTTIKQYLIDNIGEARKDCMVFLSPDKTDVVNAGGDEVSNIQQSLTALARSSSYAFFDSAWKYQFDKYNNTYRYLPLNGDIAGLCVRTDATRDPWYSPAGFNRGAIKNAVKLSWNPTAGQRDILYPLGVNPVVSFPGQGIVLFGDKTLLSQPSAFDRINVRRLFIVLEKAIARASKFSLFELNDEFTRAQFVSLVEPFLRDVKGRHGIYDFRVVCDTTNNTPQVIDTNRFIGDIYIKPARSINFIQLNFVAVRTGVNFSEIVGSV